MFPTIDPRDLPNFQPIKELNNDLILLSETIEKGAINDRDVIHLTTLIKKIGNVGNLPLFGVEQTSKFMQILQKLASQYPGIYAQIKQAVQSDAYLRSTFFSEPKEQVPPGPIPNPSKPVVATGTAEATKALSQTIIGASPAAKEAAEQPESLSMPPIDKEALLTGIIEAANLQVLQKLCGIVDPNVLLQKAFEKGNASVCRWLLKNPAIRQETVNALPEKTSGQAALKNWLLSFMNVGPVTPVTLRKVALEQGYGFKSGNLMVLQAMGESLNKAEKDKGVPLLAQCQVKVPSFVPVSNFEVQQHILKHDPGILDLWKQCQNTFRPDQVKAFLESAQPAAQQVDVTEKGRGLLQIIGTRMKDLFEKHPMNTPEMQEWLQTNAGRPIIVRSTGKEDSDELANAGGNESIPFVKPDVASLNSAMGRVIGSYFCDPNSNQPRSIQQRLAAGDKSIFTDVPFMPVLLQQMVMENPNDPKTMLRSGVLFSRPHAEMPNAILIQTGLGNNHGIVTSEVAVDSYTVENDRVQAVVRDKSTRFVHVENSGGGFLLKKVNNDRDFATTQALSQGTVKDLAAVASRMAAVYGGGNQKKSMDMEYSIQMDPKTGKQTIYLLQARPLMEANGAATNPKTYLDLPALYALSKDSVRGKTLLDGNSYVREITSNKQVIIADELSTALQRHLSALNRKDIKAIIIKRKAVLTSHEAVTLRPMGVPVIMIEDSAEFEKARTLLGNATDAQPVCICPQRAAVVSTKNLPPQSKAGFIKQGLVTFPGALETSVPVNKDLAKAMASKDKKAMDEYLKGMEGRYQLVAHKLSKFGKMPAAKGKDEVSLKQLIDLAATADKAQAGIAIARLIKSLHKELHAVIRAPGEGQASQMAAYEMLAAFSAILEQVDRRIIPSLAVTQPCSLERLYHLKPLDALIFQPASEDVVNGFSFRSALTVQKTAKSLADVALYDKKPRPEVIALELHSKSAPSYLFADKWMLFVQKLEKANPAKVNELYNIVKTLDSLQMTSHWMGQSTSSFDPKLPLETFSALKESFSANLKTFQWLERESEIIEHFEDTTDQWADPAYYVKQAEILTKGYRHWFSPPGDCLIKKQYDASGPLGKLAVLQFLGRSMNAYDSIIKAVKGSDRFKEDAKLKAFANLLKTYYQMMEQTLTLIPQALEKELMTDNWGSFLSFENYTKKMLVGTEYHIIAHESITTTGFNILCNKAEAGTCTAIEFEPRREFNVAAVHIGAKGDYAEVRWPTRLEEYFTTFHQTMEVAKNALACQCGLNKSVLSRRAREFAGEIESTFKAKISTIDFKDGKVHVEFNIPLSAHAAKLRVSYDPMDTQDRLDIGVLAFGNDEHDRWDLLSGALAMISHSQPGISLSQSPKIDYRDPIGTEGTLRIDKTFQSGPELIEQLHWLLTQMTVGQSAGAVLDRLQSQQFYSPDDVDPRVLAHAPGMLNTVMNRGLASGKSSMALKAALSTIIGTAHQDIAYYRNRSGVNEFIQNYSLRTGNGYPTLDMDDKLVTNAQRCLLELLDSMKIVPSDLDAVLSDVIVQKSLPQVVANLKEAIAYYAAIGDKIKATVAAYQPIPAIGLLKFVKKESEKKSCLELINQGILQLIKSDHLVRQFITLKPAQRKEALDYLNSIKTPLGIQNEIDRMVALAKLSDLSKDLLKRKASNASSFTPNLYHVLTSNAPLPKASLIGAAQFFTALYLTGALTEERLTRGAMNEFDAKLNTEPYNTLMPKIPPKDPKSERRNGCAWALMCMIEGLQSASEDTRNEAVAQLKALKANIEEFDKAAQALELTQLTDPALAKDRALWKNTIDAIIKHFKL